nr:hypothetical protein DBT45_10435 [Aerococcus tenax]
MRAICANIGLDWAFSAGYLEGPEARPRGVAPCEEKPVSDPRILVLTPVKDALPHLDRHFELLARLSYPADRISIGLLEGDSSDGTYDALEARLPALRQRYARAGLWKKDFNFHFPQGTERWAPPLQIARRTVLAKARNHLLFRALDDEDWVLWIDVDVVDYPEDVIERLLAYKRDILNPHCIWEWGEGTFDWNAWRDKGLLHMNDLKAEGELVRLDAVGGTMLMIRADRHRDGLIFPAFPYGRPNGRVRDPRIGEYETEGLGLMASDMGCQCWGLPFLEIKHYRERGDRDAETPPRS